MAKFTCFLFCTMYFILMSSSKDVTENKLSKRLLLKNDIDLAQEVLTLKSQMQNALAAISKVQSTSSAGEVTQIGGAGTTYVRWGSKTCPANTSELVYSGYTAGSDYGHSGAAVNYICLPPDPEWGHYDASVNNQGVSVMGTEYEIFARSQTMFGKAVGDEDAPCVVCRSPRTSMLMIPGRKSCYTGWTMEYWGYLVAGYYSHPAASEFVCLDSDPEFIIGGHENKNGKLFYLAEAKCGSLECPPYIDGRELTCVVCTK